jgi:multisubunit Na+/H+ antiporter MnhB subunit
VGVTTASREGRGRRWARDAFGLLAGGVVGAVVAVNVVIYSGIDRGYEASPAEVFDQNALVGVVVVVVLLAGPALGVALARRISRSLT